METTKDLVKFVLESWMGQEHEDIVKNYVILLGKALEADEAEFAPLETSPTEASIAKAPSYVEDFIQLVVICFENLSIHMFEKNLRDKKFSSNIILIYRQWR